MAAGPRPTAAFSGAALDIATIPSGKVYGRISFARHSDPLAYGKSPTRFSDPRRRIEKNRFGVLYLGETLKVCFLEAVLRDRRNGVVSDFPIDSIELDARISSTIALKRDLRLIDLRDDGPVRMGIPTDVVRAQSQVLARAWSVAIYEHPAAVDGILFPSRLNNQHNLAIYDRAVDGLESISTVPLLRARGFASVLNELKVALV
jgi:hypothetical protein